MKILVVGNSKNKFLPLDDIREKFLVDEKHTGDNIDSLNPWYCELTGLYYLWKHADDDIVGIEHYRRYFINETGSLLSESEIRKLLNEHDVIVTYYSKNIHDTLYNRINYFKSIDVLKKVAIALRFLHPEQYDLFVSFLNSTYHYQFNMIIANKKIINEYCEWLFGILNLVKDNFNVEDFTKRSIGYVCEIVLFSFWLTYTKKKIYDNPVIWKNDF